MAYPSQCEIITFAIVLWIFIHLKHCRPTSEYISFLLVTLPFLVSEYDHYCVSKRNSRFPPRVLEHQSSKAYQKRLPSSLTSFANKTSYNFRLLELSRPFVFDSSPYPSTKNSEQKSSERIQNITYLAHFMRNTIS